MASDSAIVDALGATDLFRSLNKRALKRLASATKVIDHEPGKQLLTQGEAGIGFHLILDGTATVAVEGRAGHQLGKGAYFGEISMIDGEPRSATITVDTPMRTVVLTSWAFRPLLDEEPAIAKELLLVLCKRIRATERAAASPTT